MAKGGDFYKGEKKKPKQSGKPSTMSSFINNAPIFSLPKMVEKKKNK
jgi:hypothetical protein